MYNHTFNTYTHFCYHTTFFTPNWAWWLGTYTVNFVPHALTHLPSDLLFSSVAGGMETGPQSHIIDLILLLSLPVLFSLSLVLHSVHGGTGGWKAERRHLGDNETAKAHLQPAPTYAHLCLILSPTLWDHRGGDSTLECYGLFFCRFSFWRWGEFVSIFLNVKYLNFRKKNIYSVSNTLESFPNVFTTHLHG